ncbi:thioesterase domain-containing protein/acyl carrier protein [Rhodopseudomonas julia]|uniref:Thioesterase domain-containing protein/acyl carrier protein n=1 Tax=Rhodopseudomonas julia TaxID=200617 RepID=A0ABU0C5S3_9BRAD|nr:thioesterase domain-containing protein [Rhodopseudomonas julia]MDQ0325872.1 thioesterase domain-containing protein/acyl carrier protein [Rhodopseudomonas julia]
MTENVFPEGAFVEPEEPYQSDDAPARSSDPACGNAPIVSALLTAWEDLLQVTHIGPNDDFFALGGSSLTAYRCLAQIRRLYGCNIPLETFYRAPTVTALAEIIAAKSQPQSRAIALQPAGSRIPIIAVHDTVIYRELAARLGSDQPFLAVPMPEEVDLLCQSYSEIAAHVVTAIRDARPRGPYILIGFCFAGRLALEIARQMKETGENIPLVVVVDGWAPGYRAGGGTMLGRTAFFLHRASAHLRAALPNGFSGLRDLHRRSDTVRRRLISTRNLVRRMMNEPEQALDPDDLALFRAIDAAGERHRVQDYQGDVLAIWSDDQPRSRFIDQAFGWTSLIHGKLSHARVVGSHTEIWSGTGLDQMAQALDKALARYNHLTDDASREVWRTHSREPGCSSPRP